MSVSLSSQPRIPDIREFVPGEEVHSPALLEAAVLDLSFHVIMNKNNALNWVVQDKSLLFIPPTLHTTMFARIDKNIKRL